MEGKPPTVVFFPEGAYGPTNNCVGIGSELQRLGVHVVFVIEESFQGTLKAKGFDEQLMRLKPKPAVEEAPGQFWKDFIRDTAPEFRKPTIEQIETLTKPIWSELIDGSKYVNQRLTEIFESVRPDVIVQDNVVAFPAVLTAGLPWVRIVSCNPLEIPDPSLPPVFSGLPTSDQRDWETFRHRYLEAHAELHEDFDQFCRDHGCPPLPEGQFMFESPFLNIYNYADELDYPRSRALNQTWKQVESCVRTTDGAFALPEEWSSTPSPTLPTGGRENEGSSTPSPPLPTGGRENKRSSTPSPTLPTSSSPSPALPTRGRGNGGQQPVIYLSLGSLGSADTGLMSRLIDALGKTDYRVIVSMGPQHDELTLADNMIGAEFLPQTSLLPHVDLVITHGGNNTVTESLYFGKPMVVLPLFWDQHDNAQRVQETGFGVRLRPYEFTDQELLGSIDQLLRNAQLNKRLKQIARRFQAEPGTVLAAQWIKALSRSRLPSATRT